MSVSLAQTPATATSTHPETLGWMRGFPPWSDRTTTFQNGSFGDTCVHEVMDMTTGLEYTEV
ncbi:hypothetical protein [Bradyrhizobium guangdongense]|uniref:hypothetical protein n=1 Tax=Bradyrhizobium guangdongense TaxID=1325090 RepID=UPI001FEFD753|nr:hypothetical protein [Bradyrhizobium guangdongense]